MVELYSSEVFYKRRGLEDVEQIMENNSAKTTWTIVAIIVGALSLAVCIGLTVAYCKMSKKEEIAESLIESGNPVDYV